MTVQTSISKFRWLELPAALPAKCISCGAVDRPVIDFGMSFDRYGAVYFCEDCIGEAARVFGYIKPQEAIAQGLKSEQSANNYLANNDLVAVPSGIYADIRSALSDLHSVADSIVLYIPVEDAEESREGDTDGSDDSAGNDSEPVADDGSKPKSSRKRRSDDVPSNPSDDLFADGFLGA
jgi:hypothetical protein